MQDNYIIHHIMLIQIRIVFPKYQPFIVFSSKSLHILPRLSLNIHDNKI